MQTEPTKTIGAGMALKAMRIAHDMDLAELAAKTGKTVPKLSQCENNHIAITKNMAEQLDKAFAFETGVMATYLRLSASKMTWQETLSLALSFYNENQRRIRKETKYATQTPISKTSHTGHRT